ncbi:CTP synthase [Patescibacteria group bacterium]|nr:CTP synthase [Patescibacteria group bacterium]
MNKKPKIIFVTGGIISGIGKGASVASISFLLKSRGFKVLPIKMDPYLNKDAGTMNPYQHGEVFVTDDGAETDLDLGHYERFLDINLDKFSNFTTGSIYSTVMELERHGDFLGKTIQIIPHVTNEIKRRVIKPAEEKKADVVVVEIGGTVGDIEEEPFLEAARQIYGEYGKENVAFIHVVKIDYVFPSEEEKTKPIQQSVRLLRESGISPDFLIVRCKKEFDGDIKEKVSMFTNVAVNHIIEAPNVSSIYEIPQNFKRKKLDENLLKRLDLPIRKIDVNGLEKRIRKMRLLKKVVNIGLVGKYVVNPDAYLSVTEAIRHGAVEAGVKVNIIEINSERDNVINKIRGLDGIVVPGGFGRRGIEGKIKAIKYARENNVPFLGLCLGLQVAVIEFARNVCGLKKANSTEFDLRTPNPVISLLPSQKNIKNMGGTMRLGAWEMKLVKGTKARELYGKDVISERHRHRYEVNPEYHDILKKGGLIFSGWSKDDERLVDMVELMDHPFFVGTQAHPEFKSRFLVPHPLFVAFMKAAAKKK